MKTIEKKVGVTKISLTTEDGKNIEIKDPKGLVVAFVEKEIEKIPDAAKEEKRKGKSKGYKHYGGVHIAGRTIDILFCFYTLTKNLLETVGERKVVEVLTFLFSSKTEEILKRERMKKEVSKLSELKDEDIN